MVEVSSGFDYNFAWEVKDMFDMYEFVTYEKRFCKDYIYFLSQEHPSRLVTQEEIDRAIKQDSLLIESLRDSLDKENVDVLNSLLVQYDVVKRSDTWKELRDAHDKLRELSSIKKEYAEAREFLHHGGDARKKVLDELDEIIDKKFTSKYERIIEKNEHYEFYLKYFDTIDELYEDACRLHVIRKTMLEIEKLQIICKEHPEFIKNKKGIFHKK